jgi:hypothetical protein
VLRDHVVVGKRGVETDIGGADEAVGDEKRVRADFLERGSQGIQAATELIDASGLDPPAQLTLHRPGVDIPRQEKARLEDRLLSDDLEEVVELHADNLPRMASWCNGIGAWLRAETRAALDLLEWRFGLFSAA